MIDLSTIAAQIDAAIEATTVVGLDEPLRASRILFTFDADPSELLEGGFVLAWPEDTRLGMDGPDGIAWRSRLLVSTATQIPAEGQRSILALVEARRRAVQAAIVVGPDDACPIEDATAIEPDATRRIIRGRWIFTEQAFNVFWTETIR